MKKNENENDTTNSNFAINLILWVGFIAVSVFIVHRLYLGEESACIIKTACLAFFLIAVFVFFHSMVFCPSRKSKKRYILISFLSCFVFFGGILLFSHHERKKDERIKDFISGLTFEVASELAKIEKAKREYKSSNFKDLKDVWEVSNVDSKLKILGFEPNNVRQFFRNYDFELSIYCDSDEFTLMKDGKTLREIKNSPIAVVIVIFVIALPFALVGCAFLLLINDYELEEEERAKQRKLDIDKSCCLTLAKYQGIAEGEKRSKETITRSLLQEGISVEAIANATGLTEEYIQRINCLKMPL